MNGMDSLTAALAYDELGFSIIPMKPGSKENPCVLWTPYQTKRASRETLKKWFSGEYSNRGIALIMGEASDGLICRDFDILESYEQWASEFPQMASRLTTVETYRGYHVFARGYMDQIRLLPGMPAKGALAFADGEFRALPGCYTVVPPSVHPSGKIYRAKNDFIIENLPRIDVEQAGFLNEYFDGDEKPTQTHRSAVFIGSAALMNTRGTQEVHKSNTRTHKNTQDVLRKTQAIEGERGDLSRARKNGQITVDPALSGLEAEINQAIDENLPDGPGKREEHIFNFARALKGMSQLTDVDPSKLKSHVREWHRRALPMITTQPFEETYDAFLRAWPRIRFPKGRIMSEFLQAAKKIPIEELPEPAREYEGQEIRLLVAICREMQRGSGDEPFWLSCRAAAKDIKIKSHVRASKMLGILARDKIITVVTRGEIKTRKASEYRYLGDL